MEEKYEVKTFMIQYVCDKCNSGNMMFQPGAVRCMAPGCLKPHRCNSCGHQDALKKQYPYTVHERVAPVADYVPAAKLNLAQVRPL